MRETIDRCYLVEEREREKRKKEIIKKLPCYADIKIKKKYYPIPTHNIFPICILHGHSNSESYAVRVHT